MLWRFYIFSPVNAWKLRWSVRICTLSTNLVDIVRPNSYGHNLHGVASVRFQSHFHGLRPRVDHQWAGFLEEPERRRTLWTVASVHHHIPFTFHALTRFCVHFSDLGLNVVIAPRIISRRIRVDQQRRSRYKVFIEFSWKLKFLEEELGVSLVNLGNLKDKRTLVGKQQTVGQIRISVHVILFISNVLECCVYFFSCLYTRDKLEVAGFYERRAGNVN